MTDQDLLSVSTWVRSCRQTWQNLMTPVVREISPRLYAGPITVQPMSLPSSLILYMDFTRGLP